MITHAIRILIKLLAIIKSLILERPFKSRNLWNIFLSFSIICEAAIHWRLLKRFKCTSKCLCLIRTETETATLFHAWRASYFRIELSFWLFQLRSNWRITSHLKDVLSLFIQTIFNNFYMALIFNFLSFKNLNVRILDFHLFLDILC